MSKIKEFTRSNLDPIANDVMEALEKVERKWGVKFGRKGIRYSDGDFRMTLTSTVVERGEGVLTASEASYKLNASIHGLPELGTTYTSRRSGVEMTIIGWNTRARKYPVMLVGSNGKKYKEAASTVKVMCQ